MESQLISEKQSLSAQTQESNASLFNEHIVYNPPSSGGSTSPLPIIHINMPANPYQLKVIQQESKSIIEDPTTLKLNRLLKTPYHFESLRICTFEEFLALTPELQEAFIESLPFNQTILPIQLWNHYKASPLHSEISFTHWILNHRYQDYINSETIDLPCHIKKSIHNYLNQDLCSKDILTKQDKTRAHLQFQINQLIHTGGINTHTTDHHTNTCLQSSFNNLCLLKSDINHSNLLPLFSSSISSKTPLNETLIVHDNNLDFTLSSLEDYEPACNIPLKQVDKQDSLYPVVQPLLNDNCPIVRPSWGTTTNPIPSINFHQPNSVTYQDSTPPLNKRLIRIFLIKQIQEINTQNTVTTERDISVYHLCNEPNLYEYRNFLTTEECDLLVQIGDRNKWNTLNNLEHNSLILNCLIMPENNNQISLLNLCCLTHDMIQRIIQRIASVFHLDHQSIIDSVMLIKYHSTTSVQRFSWNQHFIGIYMLISLNDIMNEKSVIIHTAGHIIQLPKGFGLCWCQTKISSLNQCHIECPHNQDNAYFILAYIDQPFLKNSLLG